MSWRRRLPGIGVALALLACASDGPPPADPAVRIRLELLGGFVGQRAALPPARVALLVDATEGMQAAAPGGAPRMRAAQAAAERFLGALPLATPLSLRVLGNDLDARCQDAAPDALAGERDDLLRAVSRLRARGDASLARALRALPGPAEGGYERAVVISALEDRCGDDLCAAAADLLARGVHLDLVTLGAASPPDCLAKLGAGDGGTPPVPWNRSAPVGFRVVRAGPDPAILVCGESGGLPVEVAPGPVEVVVQLDPPLRISRNFPAGTRWVLQVLDFPGLDPPERQWRWQAEPRPAPPGAAP